MNRKKTRKPRVAAAPAITREQIGTLGRRYTWARLSRLVGVSEALLRATANGSRSISAKTERALVAFVETLPPVSAVNESAADDDDDDDDEQDAADRVAPDPTSIAHQKRVLEFTLASIERAKTDPAVKYAERAGLAAAATGAIRSLARLRGEAEITTSQILRSRDWTRIMTALEECLAPFGVDVLRAVADAMRKLHVGGETPVAQ